MLPSEAKEWKDPDGVDNGELSQGWVPPHSAYPEPLSSPETTKDLAHDPEAGNARSLLRVNLVHPPEMNPVLKYNKERAPNNLNTEMNYEVNFVPS